VRLFRQLCTTCRSAFFPLSLFMSNLSVSTASTAGHGCPESRFCRSAQFLSTLSRHQGVSLSLLRASELMIIMMGSPRSPNPSPSLDTRHGTVSVQGSWSNLITFWHFAPWPRIVGAGLLTAEYRPYSERTPNTEACILYRRSTLSFENLPSPVLTSVNSGKTSQM
jgi:hypothetical protein